MEGAGRTVETSIDSMEKKSKDTVVILTKGEESRINLVSVEKETKMKRRRRRWLRMSKEKN
jgi:hypothetical protein